MCAINGIELHNIKLHLKEKVVLIFLWIHCNTFINIVAGYILSVTFCIFDLGLGVLMLASHLYFRDVDVGMFVPTQP